MLKTTFNLDQSTITNLMQRLAIKTGYSKTKLKSLLDQGAISIYGQYNNSPLKTIIKLGLKNKHLDTLDNLDYNHINSTLLMNLKVLMCFKVGKTLNIWL